MRLVLTILVTIMNLDSNNFLVLHRIDVDGEVLEAPFEVDGGATSASRAIQTVSSVEDIVDQDNIDSISCHEVLKLESLAFDSVCISICNLRGRRLISLVIFSN